MKNFLLSFLLLLHLAACGEDVGGTRRIISDNEEEIPEEEEQGPSTEDPNTIRIKCFASEDKTDLLYLIRATNDRFDYANCVLDESNCEARVRLVRTSLGSGNETRPCLAEIDNESRVRLCLSTNRNPPGDRELVRMAGEDEDIIFDFYCEQIISTILR